MSYQHYGNIGDIWKHLPLCTILEIEQPRTYVETNSAYATYALEGTPRQAYGVFHTYRHADAEPAVSGSRYIKILRDENAGSPELTRYRGSPALAMTVLGEAAERFVFFDLEQAALDDVTAYATSVGLASHVEAVRGDSVTGAHALIDELDDDAFLHIDPYTIFDRNEQGLCYFDVFTKAAAQGMRCVLWYGFMTTTDQQEIARRFRAGLAAHREIDRDRVLGVEVFMDLIQPDIILVNPGIVGCGVLTANLSEPSHSAIRAQAKGLVSLYEHGVTFEEQPGRLRLEDLPA